MSRGYAAVGLVGIKNPLNYGGVLRAAHCFDVATIIMQTRRLRHQASNTTRAERHIPTFLVDDICAATPFDCQKVAVELTDEARDIVDFDHPARAFYIFGPEDGSIPTTIIEKCQHVVKIPTLFCLNLAATVNVVLYDRAAKAARARKQVLETLESTELIRAQIEKARLR